VLAYFVISWPESRKALSLEGVLLLFVIGLAFAAVITRWSVLGFFTSPRVG
jgi:hypothetical protein